MDVAVVRTDGGHRLSGEGPITELANRYLAHLGTRSFLPATVRGYAYDLLNFTRFLQERGAALAEVVPTHIFDWLDWQAKPAKRASAKVVRLTDGRGPAPVRRGEALGLAGAMSGSTLVACRSADRVGWLRGARNA